MLNLNFYLLQSGDAVEHVSLKDTDTTSRDDGGGNGVGSLGHPLEKSALDRDSILQTVDLGPPPEEDLETTSLSRNQGEMEPPNVMVVGRDQRVDRENRSSSSTASASMLYITVTDPVKRISVSLLFCIC